jgi:DNA-binding response OmpR family regulator/signal transduction histidine kinase
MTARVNELVLNVEDEEALRYVKARDLKAAGFDVIDASTGAEALRLAEAHKPSIVLLDVQLPDINGHEVCRYIKRKWPEIMVLMTSATFTTSEDRTIGLDIGADSYLIQPAEPLELVAAVNALLRIRRSENELRRINQALQGRVDERTSELSRAIVALKSSADRMRSLLHTTYTLQGYMTADGVLLDANRAFLESVRGRLEDVVGKAFWDTPWFADTPGMPELIRQVVARAVAGEDVQQSIVLELPTGKRAFDMALRPVRNADGKVIGIVPEAVETTERLRAEEALRQAQKMEAVGQLTGGLAHDFNNLLTAVIGNLDLIRARPAHSNVKRWADNAFKAAQRGAKLTAQLLAFSRTQKLDAIPVDVNTLIEGMRELLNQSLGASITVEISLEPDLPPAIADITQLELAILNLSINSRDAMPSGGTLRIGTAIAPGDPDVILVGVSDTGAGMTQEVAARALDPFFTTKPKGKGTGLGLSQVYGIVRQVGGDISIDSKVGEGTKVTLRLPRAKSDVVRENRSDGISVRSLNSEKLLLVDDDPDVREIVSGVLSGLSYEVREAESGEDALRILGEFAPDLLLIDFAMPGMNGADVVRAARERNAKIKILFVSGFGDSSVLDAAVDNAPLLRKPFRPSELAAAVHLALHS